MHLDHLVFGFRFDIELLRLELQLELRGSQRSFERFGNSWVFILVIRAWAQPFCTPSVSDMVGQYNQFLDIKNKVNRVTLELALVKFISFLSCSFFVCFILVRNFTDGTESSLRDLGF